MYVKLVLYPNQALIRREREANILQTFPHSSHPIRFSESLVNWETSFITSVFLGVQVKWIALSVLCEFDGHQCLICSIYASLINRKLESDYWEGVIGRKEHND